MNQLLDDKLTPFPDALPKPGGTIVLTMDNLTPETHTPSSDGSRRGYTYFLRVTAPCRFAVHPASYEFDKDVEAFIDVSEIRTIRLGIAGVCDTLSIIGDTTSATAYLEEVL